MKSGRIVCQENSLITLLPNFRSGTNLISLLNTHLIVVVLLVVGLTVFKKTKVLSSQMGSDPNEIWQNHSSSKYAQSFTYFTDKMSCLITSVCACTKRP